MASKDYLAFADRLDQDKLSEILKRTDENSEYINSIVNDIVNKYCKPLDDLMKLFQGILNDENNPPTDEELDQMTMKLPNLLYFAGEGQEALGIKDDTSKAIKMEIYNKIHMETAGTVSDKEAKANAGSQYETVVNAIYVRAYKKVKLRMEAGFEQLQSIKKVISRRCLEKELGRVDSGRLYNDTRSRLYDGYDE